MAEKGQIIGIIGGSGFYDFLEGREILVKTPYGEPSACILMADYKGRQIAFLPRHGKSHQYPPHKINYRANLFALKKIGAGRILAPCAVGSLKAHIEPGQFVICDQFIAQTKNRKDTFFNGAGRAGDWGGKAGEEVDSGIAKELGIESFNRTAHISMAKPYCPDLRGLAVKMCKKLGIVCHKNGTVMVIEGPRFSTEAESELYSKSADVINMTQYPEAVLARELGMCYAGIALVTDYDAGLKSRKNTKPVSAKEVARVFKNNNEKVQELMLAIIENTGSKRNCGCSQPLKDALI